MDKKTVAVLFGGCSPEYGVSLQSAHAVITHMNRDKYDPVMIGITPEGEWFRYTGSADKIANDTWREADCVRAVISPCRGTRGLLTLVVDGLRATRLDAAMPVMHGKYGEDGTLQGLLELAGIPVVGCPTLPSALCMDKDRAHKIASLAGVRVPRSFLLTGCDSNAAIQAGEIGYPLFVKPVKAGSSFGVTRVDFPAHLEEAVSRAFEYDGEVIVEEYVPGFEVGCAVVGNDRLFVGEVDEIELRGGFFDYREKYNLITAAIHVPARIPPEKASEIKETAQILYRALGCTGFARVDMFLTPSGEIVFNEVNTIPGFTPHSRFPRMLQAAGIAFETVVDTVIELALSKI